MPNGVQYNEAKLLVMRSVPYIMKQASETLSYTFAGEREVIEKLRPAMVEHGFSIHPINAEVVHIGNYATSKGTNQQHVIIKMTYRITHAPSSGYEDVMILGEAADTSDKAIGKAQTHALKYCLFQWALLERGNDPDHIRADRSSAVGDTFKRAMGAISKTMAEKDLAVLQSKLRDPSAGFTEKQLAHLDELVEDRRKALRS